MPAVQQKIRTGLVELRTKSGPIYVSPTFWERVYLLWTFRNFHSLPRQVLNQRQQELIDKLGRTAAVSRRAPGTLIIGTVENVELKPVPQAEIVAPPKKVARMSVPVVLPLRAVGSEEISVPSKRPVRAETWRVREQSKVQSISELRQKSGELIASRAGARLRWSANKLEGWGRWAAVGLCGLAVVGFRFHFQQSQPVALVRTAPVAIAVQPSTSKSAPAVESTHSNGVQTTKSQTSPDRKQLAKVVVADVSAPPSAKHEIASSSTAVPPLSVNKEVSAEQATTGRVQIAEAPESWSYPVAPESALTGEVSLRAVVAKDGSVTEVDVLSGRRTLAQAAARAVKHWRYHAHEVNGSAVEAVTNIEIKFLGDDAVSISYPAE